MKLARTYSSSKIVLLGCYSTVADDSIRRHPQVVLIADHQRGIFSSLESFLQSLCGKSERMSQLGTPHSDFGYIKTDFSSEVKDKIKTTIDSGAFKQSRHRAIVKVQDGCNAGCSYCIIPKFRPKVWSEPEDAVLRQIKEFSSAGHKEIVLSGIFLGAYGKTTTKRSRFSESGYPLVDLIEKIITIPELGRLRLSSLEPMDLTDELLSVLASSEKVAHHLHLPLQSGSDAILRRMGRQYRRDDYLRAIEKIFSRLPDAAVTTDVIVGFPGETEEDFEQTLDVCRRVGFEKIHIFPFSPRPDTPAWDWQDEAPKNEVLQARLDSIHRLEKELAKQFRRKFLGKAVRVLVESIKKNQNDVLCVGRADQYFEVAFSGKLEFDNQFFQIMITQTDDEPVMGKTCPKLTGS
jgi:threonylcarbamoyladenosine tRNA methylthiotransferase MtaB